MADTRGNPWSFTTADVATSTAITSITRNGVRSATVNSTAHSRSANDLISIQGAAPVSWNGGYRVQSVIDANNFLIRIEDWRSALANAGAAGNVVSLLYLETIDVTQMLWDGPTAADVLSVTDAAGRTVWNPTAVAGGSLTYMKAFPIVGLVLLSMPHGILQISI
jgi:hypothetical protein